MIVAFTYTKGSIGSPISLGGPTKSKTISLKSAKIDLSAFKFLGNGWYSATIDGITLTYYDADAFLKMTWDEPWEVVFLNDGIFWQQSPLGSGIEYGPYKLFNNTNYIFTFRRAGVSDKTVVFPVTYWEPEIPPTN
ncbi:hypothetical protein ATE47_01500 [Chryseobacterium sp. IHB B 17019]|nr:hypothetical protein ATE47_01500 [Chryseobacterium sp. IHB B 17019]